MQPLETPTDHDSDTTPTVREVIAVVHRPLLTVLPEATVQAAIEIMASERISALPVVSDGRMHGIVSERDYVRKVASQRIPAWSVQVREIMTSEVITVTPEDSIRTCMALMANNRIRHLPVIEQGQLTAMVSITDLVRTLEAALRRPSPATPNV